MMRELTNKRAIASMPVAGSYRAIDFALSNMSNSHIQKVAVITQYNARSLNEHLSSSKWWDFGRKHGNRIINHRGFAISPTVKEGYILRVSEDLLDVMISTTGRLPHVFALSQQDITPYGNGLYHLNSILQPATATKAPVVGVAVTTETTVAGCATGATHLEDLEDAGRFMLEAAKAFGNGLCSFYDEEEFGRIQKLYGSMEHFQTLGKQ